MKPSISFVVYTILIISPITIYSSFLPFGWNNDEFNYNEPNEMRKVLINSPSIATKEDKTPYKECDRIYSYDRWPTRTVMVGKVPVGGNHPIPCQTMTTTDTRDVNATIKQVMLVADAGADICRVTVQGLKEAAACEHIKKGLLERGYDIPLVADVHFSPRVAMKVADYVDKVRINPGNFIDGSKKFEDIIETEEQFNKGKERIVEVLTPLVLKLKKLGKSLRIGTNHGSLSARVMSYYGDTPKGMVESAIEFAQVCVDNDFWDIIFSMKASNPKVMREAYKLLMARQREQGWNFPVHVGVTEAGEGEDGRVKSGIGIGGLLQEGIGDTIRVSLTEDPQYEIPVAKILANYGMYKHMQARTSGHRAHPRTSGHPIDFDALEAVKQNRRKIRIPSRKIDSNTDTQTQAQAQAHTHTHTHTHTGVYVTQGWQCLR
eukprot:GHVR01191629.1.p1 GENE.GHVR01191629.1~~GHVR01191629.1.p1  ORF type:complete len:433 (-),score=109.23 GHVR01191629.1:109-1407(-)